MRILPGTKNELVQWLFIGGTIISVVYMAYQIRLSHMQIAALKKRNGELSSYMNHLSVKEALHKIGIIPDEPKKYIFT